MNIDISPATIFQAITTVLLGGVGFMLRGVYGDFKKAMEEIADQKIRLAVVEEKVKQLEKENDE